ncbi:MAG: DUF4435 domain-containing protein, partial [Okeania sp. SIO3C4]|nr:DUF4435 domain-containing protein [Okeania sp. SIO3C4]
MNFLDQLRDAREPGDAYLQFIKDYKEHQKTVHLFFEGNDDVSFYNHFIKQMLPQNYSDFKYICGGKQKVYTLYEKVIERVSNKSRTLFFVDKDLFDFIDEVLPKYQNLYVTDYYSIENFIVTATMLRRVCEDFYHITDSTQLADIENQFEQEWQTFCRYLLPIMSWIIYLKKQKYQPNSNNLQMKNLFKLTNDLKIVKIICKKLFYLEKQCSVETPNNCWIQIRKIVYRLKKNEAKQYIRGKYELWFFVTFFNKITNLRDSEGKSIFKTRTQITIENAVEILAPRVPFPQSL